MGATCQFCGTEPNKSDPTFCQTREEALGCSWLPQDVRAKAIASDQRMAETLAKITRRQTFAAARRMAGVRNPSVRRLPNWAFAMELFALGSGYAHGICREMGIDPDATTATPWDVPTAPALSFSGVEE